MSHGILASVRAAALGSSALTGIEVAAPSAGSQHEETEMAEVKTAPAAENADSKPATAADLRSAFPDLVASIETDSRLSGATAERERITGILGLPAAGHRDLVKTMIADGKSTKADVALAMIEAESSTREKRLDAIKDVEETAKVVNAAPGNGQSGGVKASGPDAWRAEYAASPDLQAEFGSADYYVAFKEGEASGRVRLLKSKSM